MYSTLTLYSISYLSTWERRVVSSRGTGKPKLAHATLESFEREQAQNQAIKFYC